MKLILTEDVPNLGSLGDTIEVKPGYGRNYLLPQGMALLATGKVSKELRHRLQHLEKLREGKISFAHEQAEKLKALKLEIVRKAGPSGKLFGSVTSRDLTELLKEQDFDFERRVVQLNSSIRNVGTHEFIVRVHTEVSVTMQVKVVGETDEAEAAATTLAETTEENADETIDSDEQEALAEQEQA
ncbi:MAG: 50S ribosomal protein L9 [SAR324 cluster bacterium]|nr:50S ribosomal protein L9 [SAR324 cluster bacterium]